MKPPARRSSISLAVAAALARIEATPPPPPALDAAIDSAPLDSVRVIPVKPGHPREPAAQRFELDKEQGVCYVREVDWPKLQRALKARKQGKPDGGG